MSNNLNLSVYTDVYNPIYNNYLYKDYIFTLDIINDGTMHPVQERTEDALLPIFSYKVKHIDSKTTARDITSFIIVAKEMISIINTSLENKIRVSDDSDPRDYFDVSIGSFDMTITYSLKLDKIDYRLHPFFKEIDGKVYLDTRYLSIILTRRLYRRFVPVDAKPAIIDYQNDTFRRITNHSDPSKMVIGERESMTDALATKMVFLDPIPLHMEPIPISTKYLEIGNVSSILSVKDGYVEYHLKHLDTDEHIVSLNPNNNDFILLASWHIEPTVNAIINNVTEQSIKYFKDQFVRKLAKSVLTKIDNTQYKINHDNRSIQLYINTTTASPKYKRKVGDKVYFRYFMTTNDHIFLSNNVVNRKYRFF